MTGVFHAIRIKILPCVAGHLTTFDIGGSQIPRYAPAGGVRGFTLTSALSYLHVKGRSLITGEGGLVEMKN